MATVFICPNCGRESEWPGKCSKCGTEKQAIDVDVNELPHDGSDVNELTP